MFSTVRLRKGSGNVRLYTSPDPAGFYTPSDLARNALQQVGLTQWVETQPDGFTLHYEGPPTTGVTPMAPGVGCCGNVIGSGYLVPFVGDPVRLSEHPALQTQSLRCSIEQESAYGFDFPAAASYAPASRVTCTYAVDGPAKLLDHVVDLARALTEPFNFEPRFTGNSCGIAGMTCNFHCGSGNLLLSFRLPAARPFDPPLRFFYNSLLTVQTEFGFGWSSLYDQWIEDVDSLNPGLYRLSALATADNSLTWSINRKPGGLIETITGPGSQTETFAYDSARLTALTDSVGRTTSFQMDTAGNLTEVAIAGVALIGFQYDASRLLTRVQAADGQMTHFEYDSSRRVTKVTTPSAAATQIDYSSPTRRVVTDPRGATWTLTVDADLNVETVINPAGDTRTYSWDGSSQLQSVQNERGCTTQFFYGAMADHSYRLTEIVRPLGGLSFAYNTATGDLA